MIEVSEHIPEGLRAQAGQVYYEAFRRKLQPLVGSPVVTQRLLANAMNLDMALGAMESGRLVGLAGLHSRDGIFSQVRWGASLRSLGVPRGAWAWVALNWFGAGTSLPPGQLRIAAPAVDAGSRGQGIGARLLAAVAEKGRREGYRTVRLEVVDTNYGARRLYERSGFTMVRIHWYPINASWMGFSGDHVMVREL